MCTDMVGLVMQGLVMQYDGNDSTLCRLHNFYITLTNLFDVISLVYYFIRQVSMLQLS